ncbi:MAG: ABC transporter permease subunit [Clostridia bacterium]|nr:ABC transporter permease subunit [Clostridia bacterium]
MFKLKCDDFLIYDEATGTYSMSPEQQVRDQTERNRWKSTGFTLLKDWRLYLMLVPMILVYLLWKYLPMYELLGAFRFGNFQRVSDRPWVGFDNFKEIFVGAYAGEFWMAFRNTFVIAFYGLLFGFPLPIILALFFNEVRSNVVRSIMQVCVYLPKFISTVIVTSLTIALFAAPSTGSEGVLSKMLAAISKSGPLHAAIEEKGVVYSLEYFRAIYIITDIWEHAGYDSIVFFAAVIAVSPTSYEAAQIDGAGKMAQMRYVVIPSILSTVVIMLIMKIGGLLSVGYEKLYLLSPATSLNNYQVAEVVSTWANRLTENSGSYSPQAFGIAGEMTNNLIGMILVIGSNTIARKASDVSLY